MKKLFRLCCFVCCACTLAACSGKSVPSSGGASSSYSSSAPIRDIRAIPQDLTRFAKEAGGSKALLSSTEQAEQDARFNRVVFGPWEMTRPSIKKKEISAMFRSPRGYKMNGQRWTKPEWDDMLANADLASYPNSGRKAITTTHANLRELPSADTRFSKPTPNVQENPFDNFQYSALPQGTPLFVAHVSRDRRWYYVETPIAGGWVRADEAGWVSDSLASRYRSGSYLALIQDNVPLQSAGRSVGREHVGAFFPMAGAAAGLTALVPVRGAGGDAELAEVRFTSAQAARKPLPLTAANMARVGNVMMGQPYGWGGMMERRDCSSTTRDLFTPFGLWLPRNSSAQARSGWRNPVLGLSRESKKDTLQRDGTPFMTLAWLPGHIALYVGKYRGEPVIFHNMWGIRVIENGDDNARHVVGRCAITTLEPGKELNNRYKDSLILDRVGAFTTLGRD